MKHDETLGQAPPQGTTGAPATNRVDHGGCPSDWSALIQRLYDEAGLCDLLGITKPAGLLREAAEALQHAANMQAMDEFAEVVTAGHLRDAEPPCQTPRWDMPRRKRETLQARHDYLRSIPHHRRNQYMEAEISALDWVLHRVQA